VRCTKIELFLNEDVSKFLEEKKLKELIKWHSEFIGYPITLVVEKTEEKEVSDDEEPEKKKVENESEDKIKEIMEDEEKKVKRRRKSRQSSMSGNS
jgi:molecular chaperone HtpG